MYLQKRLILARIIDNSVITCDEIIETTKTVHTKSVLTKSTLPNFYILLTFSLITIALLIVVCTYCYLIKVKAKQKHLFPNYITNDKLRQVSY